jgi:hypothetical protein
MNMKKVLLLTAMLLALPARAEWVQVSGSKGGEKFVDPSTIKTIGPNMRRAWLRFENTKHQTSQRTLEEFDCGEERNRTVQMTGFSGSGLSGEIVVTATDSDGLGLPTSWSLQAPGTTGQAVLRYVCSQ